MDLAHLNSDYKIVVKHRNMLVCSTVILLIANLLLSFKVFTLDSKTIIIPGITHELVLTNSKVSTSYLEDISGMFLSYLLDLSPQNVSLKKDRIYKYIESSSYRQISEYFDKQIENIHKFKLSSYFTLKELDIDIDNLSISATGLLNRNFAKDGRDVQEIKVFMEFSYNLGILKLKSFTLEELKKDK